MIQRTRLKTGLAATASLAAMLVPAFAFAEDAPAPTLSSGDTAWMLTSTALVLLMTIPGLYTYPRDRLSLCAVVHSGLRSKISSRR